MALVVTGEDTARRSSTACTRNSSQCCNMPDVKDVLFKQGLDASPSTPEQFGAYIKSETAKWAKVIKASGAKPE